MEISSEKLTLLSREFGDAFYLLDSKQFEENYKRLKKVFSDVYPNFNIAYSYKTNYIPKLCKIVDNSGGYAEVVSDMELQIALKSGVLPERIIWNGPIKNTGRVEWLLLHGGTVNVDCLAELESVKSTADKHQNCIFNIGIRCNYDVADGVISRFGFDVSEKEFERAISMVKANPSLHLINLQCHFAKRNVEYWPARVMGMLKIIDYVRELLGYIPDRIDLGGGMYGNMPDSLKAQFTAQIPAYEDYAETIRPFAEYFPDSKPELLVEPGSALAGDCMKFVGKIETIKQVRGKYFATMLGSQKNISMGGVNPPMEFFPVGDGAEEYEAIDIVGYTCIEGDVLYRGYSGGLAVGDFAVFSNCGSYSIVMKPPFIMPNFPVLDICGDNVEVIKRIEKFDDLFNTYSF